MIRYYVIYWSYPHFHFGLRAPMFFMGWPMLLQVTALSFFYGLCIGCIRVLIERLISKHHEPRT